MATLTQNEKTPIIAAIQTAKADVLATIGSSADGTLGKQIADLDPATSTEVEILAAYDAYRAYRLATVDSLITSLIAKARAT